MATTHWLNLLRENICELAEKVGPTIADDIRSPQSDLGSYLIPLLLVSIYILIQFNDFAFSVGAMFSIAHDVILIIGAFALLWGVMPISMEVDQQFIAAILTYVGFSVNDTVVIFDLYPRAHRAFPETRLVKRLSTTL